MASAADILEGFIDKFEPVHQALIRAVRKGLRARFAGAWELVYDNYNFFVIGYGPTERPSDCVVSLAASAKGVSLCFMHGVSLPDPEGLLSGSGRQTRFVRVDSAATLKRPAVEALMAIARERSPIPFTPKGRGQLVIRSISAKQRPRRKMGIR
jgi:hypothetical protein